MTDHAEHVETQEPAPPQLVIELGVALFILGVTGFAFLTTWEFPGSLGDRDPGPAAMPRYLSLAGVVASTLLLVLTLRRRDGWSIPRPGRPMALFGWTVLCLVLEPLVGYVITMAVFMFGVTQLLRVPNRVIAGAFSLLAAFGTYSFFGNVLGIPL